MIELLFSRYQMRPLLPRVAFAGVLPLLFVNLSCSVADESSPSCDLFLRVLACLPQGLLGSHFGSATSMAIHALEAINMLLTLSVGNSILQCVIEIDLIIVLAQILKFTVC